MKGDWLIFMGMDNFLLGTLEHGVTLHINPCGCDDKFVMFTFNHPKAEQGYITLYTKKSIQEEGIDKLYEKLDVCLGRFIKILNKIEESGDK